MTRCRGDRELPEDIAAACTDAIDLIGALSLDAFTQDRKTIYAVIRALEIVGEAVRSCRKNVGTVLQRPRGSSWRPCATRSRMITLGSTSKRVENGVQRATSSRGTHSRNSAENGIRI